MHTIDLELYIKDNQNLVYHLQNSILQEPLDLVLDIWFEVFNLFFALIIFVMRFVVDLRSIAFFFLPFAFQHCQGPNNPTNKATSIMFFSKPTLVLVLFSLPNLKDKVGFPTVGSDRNTTQRESRLKRVQIPAYLRDYAWFINNIFFALILSVSRYNHLGYFHNFIIRIFPFYYYLVSSIEAFSANILCRCNYKYHDIWNNSKHGKLSLSFLSFT